MFVIVSTKLRKVQIKNEILSLARSLDYSQHKYAKKSLFPKLQLNQFHGFICYRSKDWIILYLQESLTEVTHFNTCCINNYDSDQLSCQRNGFRNQLVLSTSEECVISRRKQVLSVSQPWNRKQFIFCQQGGNLWVVDKYIVSYFIHVVFYTKKESHKNELVKISFLCL